MRALVRVGVTTLSLVVMLLASSDTLLSRSCLRLVHCEREREARRALRRGTLGA